MSKFKRIFITIVLTFSLVLNPTMVVMAGNDTGLDESSVSEQIQASPTPEPTPPASPETITASPSPSPSSLDDDKSWDDEETPEEDALHDAERDQKYLDYQAWLTSQGPGDQDSTGGVDGGGNVGDTSIETGDANANGVLVTSANTTAVATDDNGCGACAGDTNVVNSGNGSGSDNSATVNNTNTNTVVIDNDANVANNLDFDANTGYNDASANVGDSEIITGDANVVVTVITDANAVGMGVYQFDVNGNQNGDIILDTTTAANIGNGSGSTNDSTVNNTNTNIETITNDGNIVNNINLDANTGSNDASRNTGGDSTIETGDANVVANVINSLNTVVDGAMNVVNIFGDMVGNIVQPATANSGSECKCDTCGGEVNAANTGNGTDSTNNATVNNTNTDTTNMTNNATVENNLNLDGNTGGNTTSDNTGGFSNVETGDVTVDANVINIANINVSAGNCDPIYFVFINDISGNWQGEILGAAPGTYFYTSDGSIYFVDSNGQLVAVNNDNGADSTNNSTINNTNTNITDITNNGSITNNINVDANTGDNDASKNTGGNSSITTGDANIVVNVINFINSNFSGRKVVMTLVNVFGSWFGNFVPAGYAGDIPNPNAGGAGQQATGGSNSSSNNSSGSGSTASVSQSNAEVAGEILGGATLAFGGFGGGSGGSGGSDSGQSTNGDKVDSITKYKAPDYNQGIPFVLKILLSMIPLATATFLLRKKVSFQKA